jgi:DNA-binding beta-propeller fold protein YncE
MTIRWAQPGIVALLSVALVGPGIAGSPAAAEVTSSPTWSVSHSWQRTGGSTEVQLLRPTDVAVDADGLRYVSDLDRDLVLVLDAEGHPVGEIGAGTLDRPISVDVDETDGSLVVSDNGHDRLVRFSPEGDVLDDELGEGVLEDPAGITVLDDGTIFVADDDLDAIVHLSAAGGTLAQWGTPGTGPGQLQGPNDVAVIDADEVYVVDGSRRVQRFTLAGSFVSSFSTARPTLAEDAPASSVLVLPGGDVLVASGAVSGRTIEPVVRYAADGTFLGIFTVVEDSSSIARFGLSPDGTVLLAFADSFGGGYVQHAPDGTRLQLARGFGAGEPFGPGQLFRPLGLVVDGDGDRLIADTRNHRVQRITRAGTFVDAFGVLGDGPGELSSPGDVDLGPDGNVYVADEGNGRVQVFDPDGEALASWGDDPGPGLLGRPQSVAVAPGGDVFVADLASNRIVRFTATGTFVTSWLLPGSTPFATGIDVGPNGDVYVADSGGASADDTVLRYLADGTLVDTWQPYSGASTLFDLAVDGAGTVHVAEEDRIERFSSGGIRLSMTMVPSQHSFIDAVATDPDGTFVTITDELVETWHRPGGPLLAADLRVPDPVAPMGGAVDVELEVVNAGTVTLTGIDVDAPVLVGCDGPVGALAPGQSVLLDCTWAATQEHVDQWQRAAPAATVMSDQLAPLAVDPVSLSAQPAGAPPLLEVVDLPAGLSALGAEPDGDLVGVSPAAVVRLDEDLAVTASTPRTVPQTSVYDVDAAADGRTFLANGSLTFPGERPPEGDVVAVYPPGGGPASSWDAGDLTQLGVAPDGTVYGGNSHWASSCLPNTEICDWVRSTPQRVVRYSAGGALQTSWTDGFVQPGDVSVSPDGATVYAADRFGQQVRSYTTSGVRQHMIQLDREVRRVEAAPDGETVVVVTSDRTYLLTDELELITWVQGGAGMNALIDATGTLIRAGGGTAARHGSATTPAAPTGLAADPAPRSLALTWSLPTEIGGSDLQAVRLYRDGVLHRELAADATSFVDMDLVPNEPHEYEVSVVNGAGESPRSTPITTAATGVVGPPSGLQADAGDGAVQLAWSAPGFGADVVTGYRVFRDDAAVEDLGAAVTTLLDDGLTNGTTYEYEVAALTADGVGPRSAAVSATPASGEVPGFSDVGPGHPFLDDITWMVQQGITSGYEDGTFRPSAPVSRQAMAAFLYRLADPDPVPTAPGTASFSDVGLSHPFFAEVEWMAAEGISEGYADGTFRPSAPVTRGAMSAFLFRLADPDPVPTAPGTASFSDVGLSHPFFAEVEWMAAEGISEGYADGTFRPGAPVSRQAMAAFLHRLADGPGVGVG